MTQDPLHILIVEDDQALLRVIKMVLEKAGYRVSTAQNGRDGLQTIQKQGLPELIISDLMMPQMDGFEFLQAVRKLPGGSRPPFLFLSAYSENENVQKARLLGADDFIFKPFASQDLIEAVQAKINRHQSLQRLHSHEAMLETISLLADVINQRDYLAAGHSRRTLAMGRAFGRFLGLDDQTQILLDYGALLHDVGMIAVPQAVLNAPRELTDIERRLIKRHPVYGAELLARQPELQPVVPIVRHHHERWDGRGYPDGLSGEAIPFLARIIHILNAFDAMAHARPYRLPKNPPEIQADLEDNAGTQFDPALIARFLDMNPFLITEEV